MKRSAIFRLILVGMTVTAIPRAEAASAVAYAPGGHIITSRGQFSKEIAEQHALTTALQQYGASARLIAASDATGYCAIAVAQKGKGSVLGAALGRALREDAEKRAIEVCLNGGGTHPVVRWEWYG
jgi:hypothetical protein